MFEDFFKDIKHLNYVVQRNWDNLPESCLVGTHVDLDLFVSEGDRAALEQILERFPDVEVMTDVRSPKDDYYPSYIGVQMLTFTEWHNDIVSVPNEQEHFESLFYHNAVHKNDNPYGDKLKELFLSIHPPVQCKDGGVGYYVE